MLLADTGIRIHDLCVRFEDLVAEIKKVTATCDRRHCSLVARCCVSAKPAACILRIV